MGWRQEHAGPLLCAGNRDHTSFRLWSAAIDRMALKRISERLHSFLQHRLLALVGAAQNEGPEVFVPVACRSVRLCVHPDFQLLKIAEED